MTRRETILEVLHRWCYGIDDRDYETMARTLFTDLVYVDFSSLGKEPRVSSPEEICEKWKKSHKELDAVVHRVLNPTVVWIDDSTANATCYIHGTHYKENTAGGDTFDIFGKWIIQVTLLDEEWRISSLKFNPKYTSGNAKLA